VAAIVSMSAARAVQNASKGRSLTSWPKGFSISLPMEAKPSIMYAATGEGTVSILAICVGSWSTVAYIAFLGWRRAQGYCIIGREE